MVYTLIFFSSKCSLFHNSNIFGSCIIHILYTGCAKIKIKFRRQKVNRRFVLLRGTQQDGKHTRVEDHQSVPQNTQRHGRGVAQTEVAT